MVNAIISGRKTQTRRIIKPVQPRADGMWPAGRDPVPDCPYGQPGDRLWVRETCRAEELKSGLDGVRYLADNAFIVIENSQEASDRWFDLFSYGGKRGAGVPSIHMPRWASRITLEVTGVRVERLQEISHQDAIAEGVTGSTEMREQKLTVPHHLFADLWESINGPGSWEKNPFVWVLEFKQQGEVK